MSMRNQDMAYRTGTAATVQSPSVRKSPPQDDLKNLLSQITDQILDQDRRHVELLQDVQNRLGHLGQEARSARAHVAPQDAPVLDRIEVGMTKLGAKIADVNVDRKPGSSPVQAGQAPAAAYPAALKSGQATTQHAGQYAPAYTAPSSSPAVSQSPRTHDAPARPAAPARQAAAPVTESFELVDSQPKVRSTDPWDSDTAEALTRVYEALSSGAGGRSQPEPRPAPVMRRPPSSPQAPAPAPVSARAPASGAHVPVMEAPVAPIAQPAGCADRTWLDERLTKIAGSVERILSENRPEGVIKAFGDRFEEFEDRMGHALEGVASRSDVESLRVMEAHLTELTQHFDSAQSRLDRLDGIENHLQTVVNQLSDERLAQILPVASNQPATADLERLVTSAAEMAASQVHRLQPRDQDHAVNDLKQALNSFMSERRQGDEQTASTLDMMQQALERILERLDAIDAGPAPAAYAAEASHYEPPLHQPAMGEHEMRGPGPSRSAGFESGAYGNDQYAYASPQSSADFEEWRAPEVRGQIASDDFEGEEHYEDEGAIDPAPASVAPQSYAQEIEAPADSRPLSPIDKIRQDFIADAQRAKLKAAAEAEAKSAADASAKAPGGKKVRGKAALEASPTSSVLGSKPRLILVGSLVAIVAVMGVLLMMPRTKSKRPVAPAVTIEQPLLPSDEAPAAQPPAANAPAAPAPKASPDAAGEDLGFDSPAAPQQNLMLDPAAGEDPNVQDMSLQAPVNAPLSLDLIKLDTADAPVLPITSEGEPVEAALRLEAQSATSEPPTQTRASTATLDLPPLTVGPLSLRLAAAHGDPSAEFEVGARLAEGKGTTQDFKEAVRWYQRSATRGFAQSQYRLATLFERGLGTKTDLARARIWYQRAAEQGNVKAMHNLAVLSAGRESGTPDYTTAAKWFTAAADHGLADSQFNLGVLTEAGLGVPKDLRAAYKWFSLAARSGDAEAVRRRDVLKARLPGADLIEAELLAKSFSSKPSVPLINDARIAGEDWKKRQDLQGNG